VQNSFGGPQSSEKRDWFAGAISELLEANTDADADYLEEFILQVMNDEFDLNVEDGSSEEIATAIVAFRKSTLAGDFTKIDELLNRWQERQRKGGDVVKFQHVETGEDEDETESGSDNMEEDGSDEDVEMGGSTMPSPPKEKRVARVDEDGFTEVIGRKKR
jgi:pre-rRNA-processing protein TSR2